MKKRITARQLLKNVDAWDEVKCRAKNASADAQEGLPWEDKRNTASFQHTGLCCFASIDGPDAERAYGCEPVAVVGYGNRTWASFSMWLVP